MTQQLPMPPIPIFGLLNCRSARGGDNKWDDPQADKIAQSIPSPVIGST